MKIIFENDDNISSEEPLIIVKSNHLKGETKDIWDYINQYNKVRLDLIPLKVDEKILMIKVETIITVEVYGRELKVYTLEGIYSSVGSLTGFYNRLNLKNFIQVSKNSIININHLDFISDSFSGNMMAKLTNNIKVSISRKYVKALFECLGL